MHTRTLRNVTAIGAGPESRGILFDISGAQISVSVKSSIARGTATDIEAIGEEGGPTITVEASDYATANAVNKNGGTASVTAPGTSGNIAAAPLLDKATFHELPNSPTIDQGVVDSFTGSTDIDGDSRVIGGRLHMGADEMTLPTTTALTCLPASLEFGEEVSCAAVVEAEDWGPPTGTIAAAAAGGLKRGECELVTSGANQARCEVRAPLLTYGPGLQLAAAYRGDGSHAPSVGVSTVSADPAKASVGIACAAAPAVVDQRTNCTASVTDLGESLAPPTGEVHFYTSGPGIFPGAPGCALVQASPTSASCEVGYTPTGVGTGSHELSAIYSGDVGHDGAAGWLDLQVTKGVDLGMSLAGATDHARPWHLERNLGKKSVEISFSWIDCGEHSTPSKHAQVVERPGRAIVTALVHVPAHPPGTPCQRARRRGSIHVHLRRPVAKLKLYDGSYTPPRLRSPKANSQ